MILLGPPGCGKGTQAEKLIDEFGLVHISTGNMLRKEIADGTELGKKAKGIIDAGQLVSDEIILGMMGNRLSEPDCQQGVLFDGFPRTIAQAEGLDRLFDELDMRLDHVINIQVGDQEIIKRLSNRRTCLSCGTTYHLIYKTPEKEGVCDQCGAEIVQRDDDKEDTVKQRLETYKEQTAPLIEYYQKKGLVMDVDGQRPIDQIGQDIISRLK
ncbi:MAG: adenylate kinase [Nanoarchaeota archaeon]